MTALSQHQVNAIVQALKLLDQLAGEGLGQIMNDRTTLWSDDVVMGMADAFGIGDEIDGSIADIFLARHPTSTALPLAHPAAPQGEEDWVLVPRVPTIEMLAAFWRQKNRGTQQIGPHVDPNRMSDFDAYAAMIALAPAAIASGRKGAE